MAGFRSLPLRVTFLAGLLLAAAAVDGSAQEKVGVNSAVNPEAQGTPPGGAPRRLVIGQDVVFNERLTTSSGGQTQLLFLDQSAMTIGPNSDLTIDQFVYDPQSGTGKLAMSATRGVLRYVGGKLSKQDNAVTLRTSTATLAVRGGAFIANIVPPTPQTEAKTEAIFVFGNGLTVAPVNGQTDTLRRPGYEVIVTTGGTSGPIPVSPQQLAQLLSQLDGRQGGTGGASVIPTETIVGQSGISGISGDLGGSIQQALQNQVGGPPNAFQTQQLNTGTLQTQFIQQPTTICNNTSCTSITSNAGTTPQPPAPPQPTTFTYTGQFKNAASPSDSVAPRLNYTGTFTPQNSTFTANLVGSAPTNFGTVSFPLVAGSSSSFQGTSSAQGTLTGTGFLSADSTFFYATIAPTSQPTQRLFLSGGMPVNTAFYQPIGSTRLFAFTVQPDATLQSNMPFIRSDAGGNLANATASPFYIVAPATTPIGDASTNAAARGMQASLAIDGRGANQQSAIAVTVGTVGSQSNGQPSFSGTMRGSSLGSADFRPLRLSSAVNSAVDGAGTSFYGGNAVSGFVLTQGAVPATETDLSGRFALPYGFAQPATPVAVPTVNGTLVGTSRTTQALSGGFGGVMYPSSAAVLGGAINPYTVTGGTFLSTDASTNRIQANLNGTAQSPSAGSVALNVQYGGLSGVSGPSAFIDDRTFAAVENPAQPGQAYFVSSGAAGAPTSILPETVSYCDCKYLQWGYWGGDVPVTSPTSQTVDRAHINTWVAGVQTPLSDLNSLISQSATANYSGHAVGSVFNNGASYLAAGGFAGSYNFGTQTGAMAVTNFDGRNFAVSGRAPLTGANYTFSGAASGIQGTVNGTFYGPNAAETGGNFAFQTTAGPTYMASGIFAGKR